MARLGLFGGGGGMSSESGSGGCFRFWAWTAWEQRSTYSRRISFVTGSRMLLHTAGGETRSKHTHEGECKEGASQIATDAENRRVKSSKMCGMTTGNRPQTPAPSAIQQAESLLHSDSLYCSIKLSTGFLAYHKTALVHPAGQSITFHEHRYETKSTNSGSPLD